MKFKIKSIALGTRDYPGTGLEDLLFGLTEYIETAVEYNNDGLIGPFLKNKKIIARVHDVTDTFLLENHLKYLQKSKADILLISEASVSTDWPDLKEFKNLTTELGLFGTGITPDSLKAYREHYGMWPDYISVPLCPYHFKKDLIDFARSEGIGIISYGILGGPLQAPRLLGTFGLQFLARFAAWYSDIVVISSAAEVHQEMALVKTLEDLIDTEVPDDTVYELKQDSLKQDLGVQRKIHTYSVVSVSGQNHIFKNDYNGYISAQELQISGNPGLEHIPALDPENIKESDNIFPETALVMSEILNLPSPRWKEEVAPYYRYVVSRSLRSIFSRPRYVIKTTKTGDVFRYSVTDRVCFWKKSLEYVLYVSERIDGGYNVFFRNL